MDDSTQTVTMKFQDRETTGQSGDRDVTRADASAPVDLVALRREYEHGTELSADPPLWLFDDIAAPDEMAALIEPAREILKPAKVSGDTGGRVSPGRTGKNCWIPHNHSELTMRLATRISDIAAIPLTHAESFQVVHYGPGEQYRPHYDAWKADTGRGERCLARRGQRLITALLYLNEVEAGGSTSFPKLRLAVRAAPGTLVLFHNCRPGTNLVDERSLHGGMPVERGEKWAANLWFRERTSR
ncbi:prolyl hydroxylase family protein [Nocardia carnea]|uniref:prolyl hydroxylase family protein n=1 Tax=Nocardia carnea TaxID=37328 RepID=UPI00245854B2|nr:2OG-Fe(II) oxygenase [Nocardia carnea]